MTETQFVFCSDCAFYIAGYCTNSEKLAPYSSKPVGQNSGCIFGKDKDDRPANRTDSD